jgi:peptidyl-prolyl cis-trans isomerase B (cyclophilin B)
VSTNKQRREAARRKLERQLVARQERAKRRRQANVIASVVGTLVVIAVVVTVVVFTHNDKKSSTAASTTAKTTAAATTSATPTATTAPAVAKSPYPCKFTKSGTAARKVSLPTVTKPPKTGTVKLAVDTSRGNMTFTLTRSTGPCAVESFVSLAQQKYYDKTPCHRLVNSGIYVLQCGDPTGKGTGGPGYTVNDEYTGKETYGAGVIAMANTGAANSTGGQFFIVYKDSTAGLSKTYTVIGKVTSGLSIVDKVAAGGLAKNKIAPKLAINITSVKPA